jgi:DNA recombination-dependent growth factor C
MRLLKSRLEKWGAVNITTQLEEADAILKCETESRIVPAKVVVRVIDAQVRLVDRHTQKLIWSTKKSTSWDNRLADDIIDQLEKDRERSVNNY